MGTTCQSSLRARKNPLRVDSMRIKRVLTETWSETRTRKVKVVVKARTLKLTEIKTEREVIERQRGEESLSSLNGSRRGD